MGLTLGWSFGFSLLLTSMDFTLVWSVGFSLALQDF